MHVFKYDIFIKKCLLSISNVLLNKCPLKIFTSMKCLIVPYMGSCLQPNGLIKLPQVWGYVFSPMESFLQGKTKGPLGPFVLIISFK